MPIKKYPERVVIEFTLDCNRDCDMRPRQYIKEKYGYILDKLWGRSVDNIAKNLPNSIIFPFWRNDHSCTTSLLDLFHIN